MLLIPPNDTQLEFIKKEDCYQSADSLDQDVTQLIDWLSKQPHLPNITGELVKNLTRLFKVPGNTYGS